MIYPRFLDTIQHADTDSISNLVSDSGHVWAGSGMNLPCIRSNRLVANVAADAYDAETAYVQNDEVLAWDGRSYTLFVAGPVTGEEPPNTNYWTTGGNYAFVDVLRTPAYQWVDVVWDNPALAGVVLTSSNRSFALDWMTHFYFGNQSVLLQMRGLGHGSPTVPTGVTDSQIDYPAIVYAGQEYRIGVRYYGNQYVLELPHGKEYAFAHARFGEVFGRYLCYQPLGAKIVRAGADMQSRRVVQVPRGYALPLDALTEDLASAEFLASGGFTLSGNGDSANVIALGNACRYLRLKVISDANGDFDPVNTLAHVTWAQDRSMIPHCLIGERIPGEMTTLVGAEFETHVTGWLEYLYSEGVTECRLEVGNEMDSDGGWSLWDEVPQDKMQAYRTLYAAASDAVKAFRLLHPEIDYALIGPAFTAAIQYWTDLVEFVKWAVNNGHILDAVTWHWYCYHVDIDDLTWRCEEIHAIRPDMPIILTETGYDATNAHNLTSDAADTFRHFLNRAVRAGVTDMLFLQSLGANGSGVYTDAPHTTESNLGAVLLEYLGL